MSNSGATVIPSAVATDQSSGSSTTLECTSTLEQDKAENGSLQESLPSTEDQPDPDLSWPTWAAALISKIDLDLKTAQTAAITSPDSSAATTKLQYNSLPTLTSIRLLQFLPSIDGKIRCSLTVHDLEEDPRYDALSYTWGNPNTIGQEPEDISIHEEIKQFRDKLRGMTVDERDKGCNIFDKDVAEFRFMHPYRIFEQVEKDTPKTQVIECNGSVVKITENLQQILMLLRLLYTKDTENMETTSYLWVDALCINQDDLEERAAQVCLMARIFRSTQQVIGYLGAHHSLVEAGGALLGQMFDEILDPSLRTEVDRGVLTSFETSNMAFKFGLFSLLQRLWFRRIWIVQELALAPSINLHFGRLCLVPWEALETVLEYMKKHNLHRRLNKYCLQLLRGSSVVEYARKLQRKGIKIFGCSLKPDWQLKLEIDPLASYDFITGIKELRRQLGMSTLTYNIGEKKCEQDHDQKIKLINEDFAFYEAAPHISQNRLEREPNFTANLELLLTMFRSCMATDPRDKIYALQNILSQARNPSLHSNLKVDYKMSVESVFTHVTTSMIKESGSLSILSQVQDPSRTAFHKLPSWVPDFSVGTDRAIIGAPDQTHFYASGRVHTQANGIEIDGSELMVNGMCLGRVKQVVGSKGCYFLRTALLVLRLPEWYTKEHVSLTDYLPYFAGEKCAPIRIPIYTSDAVPARGVKSSVTKVEAYWRTLIADCFEGQHPAPAEASVGFAAWVFDEVHEANATLKKIKQFPRLSLEVKNKIWGGFIVKMGAMKGLEMGEKGGYYPPRELEAVKSELQLAAEQEYGSTARIDLSSGIRFFPGPISGLAFLFPKKKDSADSDSLLDRVNWEDLSKVRYYIDSEIPSTTYPSEPAEVVNKRVAAFQARLNEVKQGNRMFLTGKYLGMGPVSTRKGDKIWILDTANVPFVLRRRKNGTWKIIGECYVHGVMHGEALDVPGAEFERITLS